MNLDFSDEQKSLQAELRRHLQRHRGLKSARDALEGREAFTKTLWRELGELGWFSVALPERHGGQDLGHEMLCLVAEEIGRSMAALPFASSICMVAEALLQFGTEAQQQEWLPKIGRGEVVAALAIAEGAGPLRAEAIRCRYEEGKLTGSKVAVSEGMVAELIIVVALDVGVPQLFLVPAATPGLQRTAQTGVDPAHAPARLDLNSVAAQPLRTNGWEDIRRLLDRAAALMSFEQLGTADAALELSLEYVRQRSAFGRVIGSYQAIKHKLADVWIANQLARANSYYAAYALQGDAKALPLAAATARVSCCEALERAARELIQVHGGIGVAWEHDAHLFYRRGQQLALQLGGLREWQDRLVAQLGEVA